jgi:hypothetical protein
MHAIKLAAMDSVDAYDESARPRVQHETRPRDIGRQNTDDGDDPGLRAPFEQATAGSTPPYAITVFPDNALTKIPGGTNDQKNRGVLATT